MQEGRHASDDVDLEGAATGAPVAGGQEMRVAGEPTPRPAGPLGERVPRPQPAPPDWRPQAGTPGIEVNRQGQLRTNLPLPR